MPSFLRSVFTALILIPSRRLLLSVLYTFLSLIYDLQDVHLLNCHFLRREKLIKLSVG